MKNESEDIQGNSAILNPSGTADNGRSNTDKNGPKCCYVIEDVLYDANNENWCEQNLQDQLMCGAKL